MSIHSLSVYYMYFAFYRLKLLSKSHSVKKWIFLASYYGNRSEKECMDFMHMCMYSISIYMYMYM